MLKKLILLVCLVAPVAMFAQDKIAYLNSQEILLVCLKLRVLKHN